MGLAKKAGTELAKGVFTITGCIAQSATKAAAGELKVYRDEGGSVCAVYKIDADDADITFEGLLESTATLKKPGDTITIDSKTYRVKTWEVVYQNDDCQKVRGTAHLYEDID